MYFCFFFFSFDMLNRKKINFLSTRRLIIIQINGNVSGCAAREVHKRKKEICCSEGTTPECAEQKFPVPRCHRQPPRGKSACVAQGKCDKDREWMPLDSRG